MEAKGCGRIVCGQCDADLGPSGRPDETNIDDLCGECLEKQLALDAGKRTERAPEVERASVPNVLARMEHEVVAPDLGKMAAIQFYIDTCMKAALEDLRRRVETLEKWADRRD